MTDREQVRKTDPVIEHFGIEIIEADEEKTVIRMPVTQKCVNYQGNLHGAVYYSMADIVAGHHVHMDGRSHVTLSGSLNLLRGAAIGATVFATGTGIHMGRTTSVIRIEITDDQGRLLAEGNYTYFCTSK